MDAWRHYRWRNTGYSYGKVNVTALGRDHVLNLTIQNEINLFFSTMAQHPSVDQGLHVAEDSLSHSDTPHSIGFLCMSDQPNAETSTWQHTALTTDRYPCLPSGTRTRNPQQRPQTRVLNRVATGTGPCFLSIIKKIIIFIIKGKLYPVYTMKWYGRRGMEVYLHSFLTSALHEGER